jgi:hypothetical protein
MKHRIWRGVVKNGDLAVVALVLIVGVYLTTLLNTDKPEEAIIWATLIGALFGGAAVLLGNWIARYNERARNAEELELRRTRLKGIITSELVNVAAGLIQTDDFLSIATKDTSGGPLSFDLTWHLPRDMPFTYELGVELYLLDQAASDALVTLRSNLSITRGLMNDVTEREPGVFRLELIGVLNGLRFTMDIAAQCFERIAPARKIKGDGKPDELYSVALRRPRRNL